MEAKESLPVLVIKANMSAGTGRRGFWLWLVWDPASIYFDYNLSAVLGFECKCQRITRR